MSRLRKISTEIFPWTKKQNIVLLIIIASIFQFVLFYTPALAEASLKQASPINNKDNIVVNDSLNKSGSINQSAAKVIKNEVQIKTKIASTTPLANKKKTAEHREKKEIKKQAIIRTSTHIITAYNSEVSQTDSSPCITANGFNVCKHKTEDTIAANFLKFGTKVKIPALFGNRIFIVRDRMNVRYSNRIDVWMKNKQSALKFGVKIAKIVVIK